MRQKSLLVIFLVFSLASAMSHDIFNLKEISEQVHAIEMKMKAKSSAKKINQIQIASKKESLVKNVPVKAQKIEKKNKVEEKKKVELVQTKKAVKNEAASKTAPKKVVLATQKTAASSSKSTPVVKVKKTEAQLRREKWEMNRKKEAIMLAKTKKAEKVKLRKIINSIAIKNEFDKQLVDVLSHKVEEGKPISLVLKDVANSTIAHYTKTKADLIKKMNYLSAHDTELRDNLVKMKAQLKVVEENIDTLTVISIPRVKKAFNANTKNLKDLKEKKKLLGSNYLADKHAANLNIMNQANLCKTLDKVIKMLKDVLETESGSNHHIAYSQPSPTVPKKAKDLIPPPPGSEKAVLLEEFSVIKMLTELNEKDILKSFAQLTSKFDFKAVNEIKDLVRNIKNGLLNSISVIEKNQEKANFNYANLEDNMNKVIKNYDNAIKRGQKRLSKLEGILKNTKSQKQQLEGQIKSTSKDIKTNVDEGKKLEGQFASLDKSLNENLDKTKTVNMLF